MRTMWMLWLVLLVACSATQQADRPSFEPAAPAHEDPTAIETPSRDLGRADVADVHEHDAGAPIVTNAVVSECDGWKPPTAEEKQKHFETFGCPPCPCACVNGRVTCAPCAKCAPPDEGGPFGDKQRTDDDALDTVGD